MAWRAADISPGLAAERQVKGIVNYYIGKLPIVAAAGGSLHHALSRYIHYATSLAAPT